MSGLFNKHPKCGVLGKERFESKEDARHALEVWAWRKGSRAVTGRCPFCDGFHLTKGERKRPMRSKRRR